MRIVERFIGALLIHIERVLSMMYTKLKFNVIAYVIHPEQRSYIVGVQPGIPGSTKLWQ